MIELTAETLRSLLTYDPETGVLRRVGRPRIKAGKAKARLYESRQAHSRPGAAGSAVLCESV